MSDPLSHLENLGIHDMAETRSQRQRGQRGAARGTLSRGRGRGRGALPPLRVVPPLQGRSRAQYNLQGLSPNSSARMEEGVNTDFLVDHLRSYPLDNSTYYAFQLKKPVSVRIYDPGMGLNRVTCTCDDNSPCCVHIYVSDQDILMGSFS